MNQPIPRSFFKDGQRAKMTSNYHCTEGKVKIAADGDITFDCSAGEAKVLDSSELLYTQNDLELLDRTIDQVMEGDILYNDSFAYTIKVLGRVGDVVFASKGMTDSGEDVYERTCHWKELEFLDWKIVQPSNPEVMTDETAKALREEAMKKVYLPKQSGRCWHWSYGEGMAISDIWYTTNLDIARYYSGNIHKTKSSAEYYGKHYAPAFLHVFKE